MNRLFYLFSLLWCGLFCVGLQAATIDGLYEAEVPLSSQTDSERDRVLPLAFQQVLVKVVGQHLLDPDVIGELSKNASRFTQQFRLRANPEWGEYQRSLTEAAPLAWEIVVKSDEDAFELDDETLEGRVLEAPIIAPEPYLLWVRFDESMVNQLLIDSLLPIWGKERPALLLWLVIDQQGERSIVGGELSPELQTQIQSLSRQRAVPLWLPLLDFEDQQKIVSSDLWGGFDEAILDASKRYRSDMVAVGRLQQLNETIWQVQWRMLGDEVLPSVYSESSGLEAGLGDGLNLLLDQLGFRFAQYLDLDQKNKISLRIDDVVDLAAYARVSEYLSGLDNVKQLYMKKAFMGSLLVELDVLGDVDAVKQLLALGRQLKVVEHGDAELLPENELHYQLLP